MGFWIQDTISIMFPGSDKNEREILVDWLLFTPTTLQIVFVDSLPGCNDGLQSQQLSYLEFP